MATMKIEGLVSGGHSSYDGEYVVEYDPNRDGVEPGTGRPMTWYLRTTPNREEALHASGTELLELWRSVDHREPVRPDGKPNRPLTAFTVTIE